MSKHKDTNIKIIHKNLKLIFTEFNKSNIKFWLDGGALLRFKRGVRIYNASDFDIGTEIFNLNKILPLCKNLEKKGFRISLQNNFPFFCDLIKVYFPKPIEHKNLDIYLYYRNNQELLRPAIHKPRFDNLLTKILFKLLNKHKLNNYFNLLLFNIYLKTSKFLMHSIPLKYFKYNLKSINYNGLIFGIPNNLNRYLEYRYGYKWKRYSKDWNASDGKFLRIRKFNLKIKFYFSKNFNFRKFKKLPIERNYKFKFNDLQKKKIISLDAK